FVGGPDGCALCEGTKNLNSGCSNQTEKCANDPTFVSECGTTCPGGIPTYQGTLSGWSAWSTCNSWSSTQTRTRTCENATCGGNCGGASGSETQPCTLYGGKTFDQCRSWGGQPRDAGGQWVCDF